MQVLCPRCGRASPSDARYCAGCAAALQPAAAERESDGAAPRDDAFIGRERELQAIGKLLGRALSGNGATVAIAGEPGIGKTHTAQVVSQWAARARHAGPVGTLQRGTGRAALLALVAAGARLAAVARRTRCCGGCSPARPRR